MKGMVFMELSEVSNRLFLARGLPWYYLLKRLPVCLGGISIGWFWLVFEVLAWLVFEFGALKVIQKKHYF